MDETLRAAALQHAASRPEDRSQAGREPGDRRIGVVWHTQGSGKSLTMAFYAGRIIRETAMSNPTVVVLTDRNDLDDQLFSTFSHCAEVLRQPPVQARPGPTSDTARHRFGRRGVHHHPEVLPRAEGRPASAMLSDRRNIVVIADEAHRSQYDFIDGFAAHMRDALPNASFIGFTGTPIEKQDANTRAVFGDHISVYDIQRSVQDKATVPIYYESRLARLTLDDRRRPHIDDDFEEVTEGEEVERKEKLKTKWAQLEAVVGAAGRIRQVAADIVEHYETRLDAMDGKAMVVCMSRRICVDLHNELVRLRPDWRHSDDDQGAIKVVMTGSASDPLEVAAPHPQQAPPRGVGQPVPRPRRPAAGGAGARHVAHRLRRSQPAHHVRGQAHAGPRADAGHRPGQPGVPRQARRAGGGLPRTRPRAQEGAGHLHRERRPGETALDQAEAVAVMQEKYEICRGLFWGFDWSAWADGDAQARLGLLPAALEHILAQEDGKDRCTAAVRELSQAFALAVPDPAALSIRDDVAFFQAVAAALSKPTPGEARHEEDLDHAVRQIISRAVTPQGVLDIFAAAGLDKPDISVLSEEFLAEVRGLPQRNLAVEALRRLLQGEVNHRRGRNVVQARSFSEMLEQSILRYQNRAIEAAQVIEELIGLAEEIREADARGEQLGLSEEELAFYDALETNDSAVKVLGDETLRAIACELVETVRNNVTIDWTMRENVRAKLRSYVRRILRRHGYPPDKQEKATQTVLEQAEALSAAWATAA